MEKERLLAFTDGVIAVIITIMVLEMKVPQDASLGSLRSVIPVFLSYVLSFVYVAIYWNNHHHFFHLVRRVNGGMLWANINLLFWVSLVPFATGWMGSSIGLIKKEKPMDTNAAVTLKERLAVRVARYAGRAPSTAQRSRPCHPSRVADFKSEWPTSNRNQWLTSFRNRWPTSPGIRKRGLPPRSLPCAVVPRLVLSPSWSAASLTRRTRPSSR